MVRLVRHLELQRLGLAKLTLQAVPINTPRAVQYLVSGGQVGFGAKKGGTGNVARVFQALRNCLVRRRRRRNQAHCPLVEIFQCSFCVRVAEVAGRVERDGVLVTQHLHAGSKEASRHACRQRGAVHARRHRGAGRAVERVCAVREEEDEGTGAPRCLLVQTHVPAQSRFHGERKGRAARLQSRCGSTLRNVGTHPSAHGEDLCLQPLGLGVLA